MKHFNISCITACLLAIALPMPSSAQTMPLPGKWDFSTKFFVFDDETQLYQPFMMQNGDHDTHTRCLDAEFFRRSAFHTPRFYSVHQDRPGQQCTVSKEEQNGSSITWRQLCTGPNQSTVDERQHISVQSDDVAIESQNVSIDKLSNRPDNVMKTKLLIKYKRVGDCDKTP
jgi:hypothetical protein